MSNEEERSACLVDQDGKVIPLGAEDLKIGRSKSCALSLDDDEVSREHCLFHYDQSRGTPTWSVIDLNSSNGTYVNNRRIEGPRDLKSGDRVEVGKISLRFEGAGVDETFTETDIEQTQVKSELATCWLLITDVAGSTRLTQELSSEEMSRKIRAWAKDCEKIIDANDGVVNEYLGDGFLAFWKDPWCSPEGIAKMLAELDVYRKEAELNFRAVLHRAKIRIGGAVSSGKEGLLGPEVHFIFKSEKAVGKEEPRIYVTEAAMEKLAGAAPLAEARALEVNGFSEPRAFYPYEGEV